MFVGLNSVILRLGYMSAKASIRSAKFLLPLGVLFVRL